MAETYVTEFNNLFVTKPPAKVNRYGVELRSIPFTYTQVLAGTAADTVVLGRLPACSELHLVMCWFAFAGFTSGMTLSVGWKAYTDNDGVVQAASAAGLISAMDVTNGTGVWQGGMMAISTPDDLLPALYVKDFNNRGPVDIYGTFNDQVPGAAATLSGRLYYCSMG